MHNSEWLRKLISLQFLFKFTPIVNQVMWHPYDLAEWLHFRVESILKIEDVDYDQKNMTQLSSISLLSLPRFCNREYKSLNAFEHNEYFFYTYMLWY